MEQVVILLIVALATGVQALLKKFKGTPEELAAKNPPPERDQPSAPVELTEADKRYREIQEEVRRRVAQRQQQPQTMRPSSAPQENYHSSPQTTAPVARPARGIYQRPAQPPTRTFTIAPPEIYTPTASAARPMAMPIMPVESASTTEAAATEAAAYALPEVSEAAGAATIPPAVGSIRALLTVQSSVRQAFVLREVLDRPLSLRPMAHGGHDAWL